MGRVPATPLDVESAEAAERAAAREREQLRIHNMNSLQWLAWQAEKAVESGLDTCVLRRAVASAERLSGGEP